jgi:hypothetical protein
VPVRRAPVIVLALAAALGGLSLGILAAVAGSPGASVPGGSGNVAGLGSALPSQPPLASPTPSDVAPTSSPTVPPSASAPPLPTPTPGPRLVPAPLTGRLVTQQVAARHPIAVMIDDHSDARPQSGFSAASVVWQAPAEGGIPRYMLVFQDQVPADVGPVRSARIYYVQWASELRALYVHSGGSPQALATLRAKGNGQLVYNADEFAWGRYFRRVDFKFAPHNLYSTGKQLRALAATRGAKDEALEWPWRFAPDAPIGQRPVGGRIQVAYRASTIRYDYDRISNTYLRSVTGEKAQLDRSTKRRVAPKNVVVMLMHFGPLNDGSGKARLEAQVTGTGPAWISSNGVTIKGTWKKAGQTAPTSFFDAAGKPVRLTVGQTFIQVMPYGSAMTFTKGKPAPPDPFPAGLDPR